MDSTTPEVPSNGAALVVAHVAPPPVPTPIPWWHTAALVVVLLGFSALNARSGHHSHSGRGHMMIYLSTIAYEWLLTAWVWWGVRRSGGTLRGLIGGAWHRVEDALMDVGIGIGAWFGILMALYGLLLIFVLATGGIHHLGSVDDAQKRIGFLAPRGVADILMWVALSSTAGFCEEVIFRGYLQQQATRWLGNRWLALVVASVIFGLCHTYEGTRSVLLITLLGFGFGVVSFVRGSLRPSMVAHTSQDLVTGLLLGALQ